MELCELLPWWEAWLGPMLGALFGGGTTVAVVEHLRKRSVRKLARAANEHWSERALIAAEAKMLVTFVGISGTITPMFLISGWTSGSGCSPIGLVLPGFVLVVFSSLFRAIGGIDAAYRGSARSVAERLRSVATFLLVLYPVLLVVLLANVVNVLAPTDRWLWTWVGAVAVIHVVSSTGILYGVARLLGLATPARESVQRAVERAQRDAPTTVRRVDELAWLMPNAVALPLRGIVAFTKTAADEMTDEELHAIALHELGHLREPAFVRWMRPVLGGLKYLAASVAVPLLASEHQAAFVAILVCGFAAGFASMRLSRRHEADADAHGAAHSPAYARALETLYRLAGIPAVISKQATHPSLYDRMVEAGVTPDFPRPRVPRQLRAMLVLVPAPFILLGFLFAGSWLKDFDDEDRERQALVSLALGGGATDLLALARETSDDHLAELLYERAIAEDPSLAPDP